jgi:hypothetical protein
VPLSDGEVAMLRQLPAFEPRLERKLG